MANSKVEKAANGSGIARRFGLLALCFALVTGLLGGRPAAAAAAGGRQSFFHSVEVRSANIAPFTKWRSAIARTAREVAREHGRDCSSDGGAGCRYRELDAFVETLRNKSRRDQLIAVNAYMNARPYVTDARNWGENDYWATPAEFLTRSGDCEDYAIAKFFALKRLGWNADALRVAAVKDLDRGAGHAVLIAFDGDKSWLLDNQIKQVVETGTVRRYEPVYSINEHAWWRHRVVAPSPATGVATASGD
jgi:predicted transglutaminase-like cysteine proteinase